MDVEELVRSGLEDATADVVGGPDLARTIRNGRRRRHARTGLVAVTSVAALTAAVVALPLGSAAHRDKVPASPAASEIKDFVPGTDMDEKIQRIVLEHLPGLPTARSVIPTDWHKGFFERPDELSQTREWRATYHLGPHDDLVVSLKYGDSANSPELCFPIDHDADSSRVSGQACFGPQKVNQVENSARFGPQKTNHVGDSPRYRPQNTAAADDSDPPTGAPTESDLPHSLRFTFSSMIKRSPVYLVGVAEQISVDDYDQAVKRRHYTDDQLDSVVTDPRLTFPEPSGPPVK